MFVSAFVKETCFTSLSSFSKKAQSEMNGKLIIS